MILVPAMSLEDWKKLVTDPDEQWKPGSPANALAASWHGLMRFPREISALFSGSDATRGATLLLAIPEHQVPLAGGERASQTDLWLLARTPIGLLSVVVEGKVSESFGPSVGDWQAVETRERREPWAALCGLLEIEPACDGRSGLNYSTAPRARCWRQGASAHVVRRSSSIPSAGVATASATFNISSRSWAGSSKRQEHWSRSHHGKASNCSSDGRKGRYSAIRLRAEPGTLHLGFQFRMTVIGEAVPSVTAEFITNDWPSADTRYCCLNARVTVLPTFVPNNARGTPGSMVLYLRES